jgi:sigma-B regulation protein RsbU (phosphoserine phosphatase)
VLDASGLVESANAELLRLLGRHRDDVVGVRTLPSLVSAGGRIYFDTHIFPMLAVEGAVREVALDVVRPDGTRVPVLLNANVDLDEHVGIEAVRVVLLEARDRRRYEADLLEAMRSTEEARRVAAELAVTLQQTLIPPSPPRVDGLAISAAYRPAGDGSEVGGDFYDVFQLGPDDWVVVIGDVCGKGVEAAVVTSLVRYTLRAAVVEHPRPADALRLLNATMLRDRIERFCTVALLRLRRVDDRWTAEVASGGHPLPRLRAAAGTTSTVGRPGSLIGVLDEPDLYDVEVALRSGDTLLLHTDGVPDGRSGTTFFGEERIERILAEGHGSARSLADALLSEVLAFQGGSTRDDIAIVVIEVD